MKLIRCDKCGKELKYFLDVYRYKGGKFNTVDIDLCKDCHNEFKKWLEDKKGE